MIPAIASVMAGWWERERRHCTRRQPGRTVYTCTSGGRRWLQSELADALDHQTTHHDRPGDPA